MLAKPLHAAALQREPDKQAGAAGPVRDIFQILHQDTPEQAPFHLPPKQIGHFPLALGEQLAQHWKPRRRLNRLRRCG